MFGFLNKEKLKKDDLKGIAQLMYQDYRMMLGIESI